MSLKCRNELQILAAYNESFIGSQMTTDFVFLDKNLSIREAMRFLIEQETELDNISKVYVVNQKGEERREYYKPIDMHGSTWWVRLNISEKDYDKEVDCLVNIGVLAGVTTVILFVVVTSLLIAYFLKPLEKVAESTRRANTEAQNAGKKED